MYLDRHAGLDPASRRHWKHWIPASAGMTAKNELQFIDKHYRGVAVL